MLDFSFLEELEVEGCRQAQRVEANVAGNGLIFQRGRDLHERHRLRHLHGHDIAAATGDGARLAYRRAGQGGRKASDDGGNESHFVLCWFNVVEMGEKDASLQSGVS